MEECEVDHPPIPFQLFYERSLNHIEPSMRRKLMDWFLYDKGVSHERIKLIGR